MHGELVGLPCVRHGDTVGVVVEDVRGGRLGAKLNVVGASADGEGLSGATPGFLPPNDDLLLCDEGDFRLRVLTTGVFSPDGVFGVLPT